MGTIFQLNSTSNVQKKEHSKGGRQYTKRKKSADEKEEPFRKSRCLEGKGSAMSTKAIEAEKEPTKEVKTDKELIEISSGEELQDFPWTKSLKSELEVDKRNLHRPRTIPCTKYGSLTIGLSHTQ